MSIVQYDNTGRDSSLNIFVITSLRDLCPAAPQKLIFASCCVVLCMAFKRPAHPTHTPRPSSPFPSLSICRFASHLAFAMAIDFAMQIALDGPCRGKAEPTQRRNSETWTVGFLIYHDIERKGGGSAGRRGPGGRRVAACLRAVGAFS